MHSGNVSACVRRVTDRIDSSVGEHMLNDKRIQLISITGTKSVVRHGAQVFVKRFGKSILELDGNKAISLIPNANLTIALQQLGKIFLSNR